MDEGEAERQVGPAALRQRPALLAAPAEAGGGVGDVPDEWEDRSRALGAQRAVEGLDDGGVGVDGDRVLRLSRGDASVAPVVSAEVPEEPAAPEAGRLANEGLLGRCVRLVVGIGGAVV